MIKKGGKVIKFKAGAYTESQHKSYLKRIDLEMTGSKLIAL